jgi:vacuolar-type H+-ATPase subunit I/STV1
MTTNGYSSDRFNRIESILSRLAEQQEADQAEMARLRQLVESNAKAIQANSATIAAADRILSEAVGRAARSVEILAQAVEEDRLNFQEYRERNDANVASLNAAVERLEAIMAYLVGRENQG